MLKYLLIIYAIATLRRKSGFVVIDYYKINNYIERLLRKDNTLFLDVKELNLIKTKLKKNNYKVYNAYPDSDKVILYCEKLPQIRLFKIESFLEIRHQDILGSLFALQLNPSYFGDIVFFNGNFYLYSLNEIGEFLLNNFKKVGKSSVKLVEVSIDTLKDYEREYDIIDIIVSSLRIDNVVSSVCNFSRKIALEKFKEKEVLVNYEICSKSSYILKENDIFSIRKFGKFKYQSVLKTTKSSKFIIRILKYK